jgi:alkylation response protein AidB-like acyl-CoA dehydrogenase
VGIAALSWLAVWCRTDDDSPQVGTWLIPADAAGVRVVPTWDCMGMRGTAGHDVLLDTVVVPEHYAVELRPASQGTGNDPVVSAWKCVLIASVYQGIAMAARDWLVNYLKSRRPGSLSDALSSVPRMQDAVGEIECLLKTNAMLLSEVACAADAGNAPRSTRSGVAKVVVTRNAIRAVERAMQLAGTHGLSRANSLERHLRDVICGPLHMPQDDLVHSAAGRAALA